MITIRKNGIIIACLGILLVAAGVLNYYLSRSGGEQTTSAGGLLAASRTTAPGATAAAGAQTGETAASASSMDSISVFSQQREETRADEITYLDSIIQNEKTDAATLRMAQEEKLKLVENMELEMLIEGLLRAKGFTNIVTRGETSISVVVAADSLSEVEVAQILDIVRRESGETAENIKIIPVVK